MRSYLHLRKLLILTIVGTLLGSPELAVGQKSSGLRWMTRGARKAVKPVRPAPKAIEIQSARRAAQIRSPRDAPHMRGIESQADDWRKKLVETMRDEVRDNLLEAIIKQGTEDSDRSPQFGPEAPAGSDRTAEDLASLGPDDIRGYQFLVFDDIEPAASLPDLQQLIVDEGTSREITVVVARSKPETAAFVRWLALNPNRVEMVKFALKRSQFLTTGAMQRFFDDKPRSLPCEVDLSGVWSRPIWDDLPEYGTVFKRWLARNRFDVEPTLPSQPRMISTIDSSLESADGARLYCVLLAPERKDSWARVDQPAREVGGDFWGPQGDWTASFPELPVLTTLSGPSP
jgi:hypothetical protein